MKTILILLRDTIVILGMSSAILLLIFGCLITGGTFNNYFYDKFMNLYYYVERIIGE